MNNVQQPLVEIQNVTTRFGSAVVHEKLNLTIHRGEILAIVGGSGSGKTTLMREILMLHRPSAGCIKVFGHDIVTADIATQMAIRKRWGVMFQQGALFSSLTVLENVSFPLLEFTDLSKELVHEIAQIKLSMAKFPLEAMLKYPAELSGGMLKRAALARAIALDPELLFLDEPTSGLDPQSAGFLDELVLNLQASLGLTIVVVTHDMDTLWKVPNRVAFLGEKRVLAVGPMDELVKTEHRLLWDYFEGPRARAAQDAAKNHHHEE